MTQQLSKICIGCWQQMRIPVPLRGVLSAPLRPFGIRPSRMNPNTCTICELMFSRVMRSRNITVDVTVLFADLRGYTRLSQDLPAEVMSGVLDAFYDECASAIWAHDGLLNKTIGDAVMAVFNFPIRRPDHARNALLAGRAIQSRVGVLQAAVRRSPGHDGEPLGIGIGIDSGDVSFGEFGRSHRDLTAIGTVVITAARAQSAAAAGEILLTAAAAGRADPALTGTPPREYRVKGFDAPLPLYSV
jgi:class 3 adenylate cyclase